MRRAVLGTLIGALALLVVGCLYACASVLTVVANFVTVPLGLGVAVTWPRKEIIQIPFRVRWHGEQKSLASFMIPLWLLGGVVAFLWWGFSNYPNEATEVLIFMGKAVGVLAGVVAVALLLFCSSDIKNRFIGDEATGPVADAYRMSKAYVKAKKEGICPLVEFVEPPEPSPPST